MMVSLFSIFDPSSGSISLNWVSVILFILLYWGSSWCVSSVVVLQWKGSMSLVQEMVSVMGVKSKSICLIMPLFISIFMYNVMGLMPYVFTSTSHMVVTVALALPLWGCVCMFNWVEHTQGSLAHLVPSGTPQILIPFMVVIEMLSGLMRPLTLSLRLSANMLAGHLLLSLVGNGGLFISPLVSMQFMSQTLLALLEIAVAVIQAYVFSVLVSLYFSEYITLAQLISSVYFSWFLVVILGV